MGQSYTVSNRPFIIRIKSVRSKFVVILLFTDVCHKQIYRKIAGDRRLSAANLPNFG